MFRWLIPLLCLAAPIAAQPQTEVDLELVLAADVSRSMSPNELEIQRRGYAEALTSDEVWGAIENGMIGRIALTYMEWAGVSHHRVVVPWTLIQTRADAAAVAEQLIENYDSAMRRTSISGALEAAAFSFDLNDFIGLRRVIDVSGDGPNNQGMPVLQARHRVLEQGIIINGLPLMTQDELSLRWGIPDLDAYYANCVIGGPGSFALPVWDWKDFEPTLRRKLVLELAGRPVTERDRTAPQHVDGYDCMIGEKIWQRNMGDWYSP